MDARPDRIAKRAPHDISERESGAVTSCDGTFIGYHVMGQGPGVVLVQGAMGTAYNYEQLSCILAKDFTVFRPDRRGRGMSPKTYNPEHTIGRDVEDLAALLEKTGDRFVFGLSSGAMIVLESLRLRLSIDKAIAYEPPFYFAGMAHPMIARFNRQIEDGQSAAALATAFRIVGLGPPVMRYVPDLVLRIMTSRLLRSDKSRGPDPYAGLAELLPAMRYDFADVGGMDGKLMSLRAIQTPLLLLRGDRSPAYLKAAASAVKAVVQGAELRELEGLDHSGPWNIDRGGNPEPVARALINFFGS